MLPRRAVEGGSSTGIHASRSGDVLYHSGTSDATRREFDRRLVAPVHGEVVYGSSHHVQIHPSSLQDPGIAV